MKKTGIRKTKIFTPTRIIMLGFLLSIVVGSILLYADFSNNGDVSFVDALFLATSSVCVTGLSTLNVGTTFTVFGQIIILILIQVGGLGVITFTAGLILAFGKRLSLSEKILVQNAYNVNTMTGLAQFTKRLFKAAFLIEL
ncbi:MAG: hypothetical protein K6B75_05205, partial [Lachnospiraceae bacterium]|nr:hypothetical protein [Lachnospiraceae bacterium]